MNISTAAAIALAAPGCLLGVATGIGLVMTVFGQSPMWPHESVNLAEAAGASDESEMIRLIEEGARSERPVPDSSRTDLRISDAPHASRGRCCERRSDDGGAAGRERGDAGCSAVDAPALHRRRKQGSLPCSTSCDLLARRRTARVWSDHGGPTDLRARRSFRLISRQSYAWTDHGDRWTPRNSVIEDAAPSPTLTGDPSTDQICRRSLRSFLVPFCE